MNKIALAANKNRADNLSICQMLKSNGCNTASVFGFTEALVLLQRIPLDLGVLDSLFEDARDLIELITTEKRISKIPILMMRNRGIIEDVRNECTLTLSSMFMIQRSGYTECEV